MRIAGIFVVLCVFASVTHAQVYKCTDANGNLTFSDKPCAADAEVMEGIDGGTSGFEAALGGPPSSITLASGSILRFKEIISIEVRTPMGYRTGKEGMHVHYDGTDRLVAFENLVSMNVLTWDRKGCGNLSHLCSPRVRIKTREREINARYEALRNIKILLDDELDGVEKEMTVWFATENKPHIRSIRF